MEEFEEEEEEAEEERATFAIRHKSLSFRGWVSFVSNFSVRLMLLFLLRFVVA